MKGRFGCFAFCGAALLATLALAAFPILTLFRRGRKKRSTEFL